MSRIRAIKPEFFTSDSLAAASRDARLLFIGLWTMADRDGRLDDRPKKIRAVLFPYDADANIEGWIGELGAIGAIVRYLADGVARIAIPSFSKHQHVHTKEPPSTIPAPGETKPSPVKSVEAKVSAEEKPPRAGSQASEPPPVDLNEIVEAINRPRRKRGISPINAMTLHGQAAAPFFALVDMFPVDTLARIETEHEAWLATATAKELADGYPWRWWLKEPESGTARAKKPEPEPEPERPPRRKSEYKPLTWDTE